MSSALDKETLEAWQAELHEGARLKLHRTEQRALVDEVLAARQTLAANEITIYGLRVQLNALNETVAIQRGRGTRAGALPDALTDGTQIIAWRPDLWGELTPDRKCDWGSCENPVTCARLDTAMGGFVQCCTSCSEQRVLIRLTHHPVVAILGSEESGRS